MEFKDKQRAPYHPPSRRITSFLLILFISFSIVSNIKAQQSIPDSAVKARITFIQQSLEKDAIKTGWWWWGWLAGYSGATIGQVAAGFASDNLKSRQDLFLGAATTFVGAAGQFVTPVKISKFPGLLNEMPENTDAERLAKLKKAEEYLQMRAKAEIDGRSWKVHAVSTEVNMASGFVTWFGFKRGWQAGLINFAINEAITEAQIWSQPMKAKKSLKTYREKYIDGEKMALRKPSFTYALSASLNGLNLQVHF